MFPVETTAETIALRRLMLCQQIAWDSRLSVGGGGGGGEVLLSQELIRPTDTMPFVVCSHMLDSHSRTANITEAQTRRRGSLAVSLTDNMSTKGSD